MKKFLPLLFLLLPVIGWAQPCPAAGPTRTQIRDTLFRPDGTRFSGSITVSWPTFTSSQGCAIQSGQLSITINNGNLNALLVPTEAPPLTTAVGYTAVYALTNGTPLAPPLTETWVVPGTGPATLDQVRNPPVPTSIFGAYRTIADEGTSLTRRNLVNFTGATITCTDNPSLARTDCAIAGSGTGDFVGPGSSVDSQIVLFSGVTGKLGKALTITGIPKLASGVPSVASPGTDYVLPSGNVATSSALDHDPAACPVGQAVSDVSATVALTCVTLTAAQITNAFDTTANNTLGAHYSDSTDIATPALPIAGHTRTYTKGGKECSVDSAGNENCTGAGGGGGVLTQLNTDATPVQTLTKTNDTNVTLTIVDNGTGDHKFNLGWTGTLAAGRLNANTPQSITNDTNVTGSIAAQVLTLGWTGTLAKARQNATTVYTDQSNSYGANLQDFSAATLKIPVSAGATAAVNGLIAYDSTANMLHAAQSTADAFIPQFTATPADNDCVKWTVSGSNYKLNTAGGQCTAAAGFFSRSTAATSAFSATPTFSLADITAKSPVRFEPGTLTANVTSVTFTNKTAGAKFSIAWTQDGTGGRTIAYGASASNTCTIAPRANITTTQFFEIAADGTTVLGTSCSTNDVGVIITGSETSAVTTTSSAVGTLTYDSGSHTVTYYANASSNRHAIPQVASGDQMAASDLSNGTSGSGAVCLVTSCVMITPNLGTPSALVLTNATALPAAQVSSGALVNGMTATTQSANDNSTKLATTAYVDTTKCTTTITTGTTATLSTCFTVNQEATAATGVTYTLPTAASGLQYCIDNGYNGSAPDTGILTFATSATGQFMVFTDGTLTATGGNVTSAGAARDGACVYGIDSTHWMFLPHSGTWTKH